MKWSPITLGKFAQFSLPDPIICSAGLSADSLPTHWRATFSFKAKKSLFLPCLTVTHPIRSCLAMSQTSKKSSMSSLKT